MEDFIPYETLLKLEKKGYKGKTIRYHGHIYDVLKWLREEKKIHFEFVAAAYGYNVIISQTPDAGGTDYYYTHMNDDGPNDGGAWDRYEDAALYCIEYVIDNLISYESSRAY